MVPFQTLPQAYTCHNSVEMVHSPYYAEEVVLIGLVVDDHKERAADDDAVGTAYHWWFVVAYR